MTIELCPLPENALLQTYNKREGCHADCYVTDIPTDITFPDYITAFYTTPLFKLERFILKFAARSPSTDAEAKQLAAAETQRFAAWTEEARTENQLLMQAFSTRSWFMIEPVDTGTRLYFGSAVTPLTGTAKRGFMFDVLLPFHKLYSRALLASAKRRLRKHHT